MIICLTKQVKTLKSIKCNLVKSQNETCTFSDLSKIKLSEFMDSTNLYKKDAYDFSKEYNYIEKAINHIKKNKKIYKLLVVLLSTTVNFGVFGATTAFALEAGSLGYKLYIKGVEICKIICILGFMVEAGKCVLTGTLESLWRIAVVYCSFMLSIRYLPDIVDWFFTK